MCLVHACMDTDTDPSPVLLSYQRGAGEKWKEWTCCCTMYFCIYLFCSSNDDAWSCGKSDMASWTVFFGSWGSLPSNNDTANKRASRQQQGKNWEGGTFYFFVFCFRAFSLSFQEKNYIMDCSALFLLVWKSTLHFYSSESITGAVTAAKSNYINTSSATTTQQQQCGIKGELMNGSVECLDIFWLVQAKKDLLLFQPVYVFFPHSFKPHPFKRVFLFLIEPWYVLLYPIIFFWGCSGINSAVLADKVKISVKETVTTTEAKKRFFLATLVDRISCPCYFPLLFLFLRSKESQQSVVFSLVLLR